MTTPTAVYVGWTGRGNLGDDAIADALLQHIPGVAPWHVPTDPTAFAARLLAGAGVGARRRTVLLGGGTVVGRRNWRLLLAATGTLLARRRPWHLIGVGVEDPAFQGRNSFSDRDELRRWVDVCGWFERITVRGPRSQELLASVGVNSEIVGDPALLHGPSAPVEPRERLLGVNLGFGDDLWGHDHDRVVAETAALVRELAGAGWSSRLIVVNLKDLPSATACVERAGVNVPIHIATTVPDYLAAVADCTVLVAERLHALVLGAAAGVPLVGLEYQPKCADFLASVGCGERSLRTDTVTAGALIDHVRSLADHRDTESALLATHVGALRELLLEEVAWIRNRLCANEVVGSAP
ncbi:polysaccharide pyruvyl transferase family protein [Kutzneria buriramensis]|uniref:Polysaccharide pyruvyl transferase WcaK-like protein n=1 Tax=Kutzneria buriramensis TaxID=1045776 RepID=A0A3E0HDS6_9PSEU|nr:polysaccharide pyruvyl transferase family protein [Kutzneria buriramensis]REH42571.1 polysaccharide pyruvyl transferase WcaK-like protein [Kutzneria buriramensis]